MRNMKALFMSLVGVFILSTILAPLSTVKASTETENGIEVLTQTSEYLEYIHTKDEGVFKVVENIDPETGNVESEIYKLNSSNSYELYEEQSVTVSEDNNLIHETKVIGGETTSRVLENPVEKNTHTSDDTVSTFNLDPTTPWTYTKTEEYYTQSFLGMTVSGVMSILDTYWGIPATADWAVDGIANFLDSQHDSMFLNKVVSRKNDLQSPILAGTQEIITLYYTSAKDEVIDRQVREDCAEGFDCSAP